MRPTASPQPILPVCLLLGGKPCLVVGGGTIATRKVQHLLEAEAQVTVVSPTLSGELQSLLQAGKLRHLARPFAAADVQGQCLVFAATDNADVNRQVLDNCHQQRILCGAADSNWPQGDLLMPATCRKNGLVVTVSTGGRSCSHARAVKEQIAKLLDTMVKD
jgi:siroheme synthase-like protein